MAGSCHSLLIFSVCTGAAVTVLSMLHNGVEAHPNATPRQPTCCTKSPKGLLQRKGHMAGLGYWQSSSSAVYDSFILSVAAVYSSMAPISLST